MNLENLDPGGKIHSDHLERAAYIYIRQSSPKLGNGPDLTKSNAGEGCTGLTFS